MRSTKNTQQSQSSSNEVEQSPASGPREIGESTREIQIICKDCREVIVKTDIRHHSTSIDYITRNKFHVMMSVPPDVVVNALTINLRNRHMITICHYCGLRLTEVEDEMFVSEKNGFGRLVFRKSHTMALIID